MAGNEPLVSYVVTVYNKEPYVGATVDSLLRQEGDISSEFIFVDDVSTDRSLAVIEGRTRGMANVTMIRNTVNAGPSIRLNQGARQARGQYLQFIDSDDILAANATAVMLKLADRHKADVVHGGWERSNESSAALVGRRMPEEPPVQVSDVPMRFVFEERIRRMSQMVRRDTFLAAGGCDERVFVQDESLALRLARAAKKLVLVNAPVIFIPKIDGALSGNISQLNHDRFLASYDMLEEFPELDGTVRRLLYQRCLSSMWKEHRLHHGALVAACSPLFLRYLRANVGLPRVDDGQLRKMHDFFAKLKGVRRVAHPRA